MLRITIPEDELYNEKTREFTPLKEEILELEHSLVSLSKWESKWCKPFYSKKEKTYEETLDYIRCMTVTPNVDPDVYKRLDDKIVNEIYEYIKAPMTATTFNNMKDKVGGGNGEQVTSELIYYWMVTFNIPVEFESWHINRLMTLIRICEIKSQPPKKMGKRALMSRNAQLNAARRQQLNTRG